MVSKIYHTMADPTDRAGVAARPTPATSWRSSACKDSITGDTLCDLQHPILLERITFAEAVVSRSIEPESSADKDKLVDVLKLLKQRGPDLHLDVDPETGQTLMSGMGMLHLEIKQHRMERDFHLKVRVGKPRVSYRETLRSRCTSWASASARRARRGCSPR